MLLVLGAEAPAMIFFITKSQIAVNYAKNLKAKMILIEHRYYGKSRPTDQIRTSDLRFLTSSQALADYAEFIQNYKKNHVETKEVAWIAIGGSYSAAIAAFLRLKYPHLVDAAVASSPSLVAVRSFSEYLKLTADALEIGCRVSMDFAFAKINEIITFGKKKDVIQLSKKMNTCQTLDTKKAKDMALFSQSLAFRVAIIVQHHKIDRHSFFYSAPNMTIDEMCDIMTDGRIESDLDRLVELVRRQDESTDSKCFDTSYTSYVKSMQTTDWDDIPESERQWMYQCCTQLGYWQSSDDWSQPFGHNFPEENLQQRCADIFGSEFDAEMTKSGIENHNLMFGGLNTRGSRIIFISGSVDPWRTLGIISQEQVHDPESEVIFIEGSGHRADLMPDNSIWDSQQLKDARTQTLKFLQRVVRDIRY